MAREMRGTILQSRTDLGVLLPGGKAGVLLLHDIGGAAGELRGHANAFARSGYTVSCPQLVALGAETSPGHGGAGMLVSEAEQALARMRPRCDSVVVVGMGYGAMLALELARHNASAVQAVVLVDPQAWLPALPFAVPSALSGKIKQTWVAGLVAMTGRHRTVTRSRPISGAAATGTSASRREGLRGLSRLLDSVHAGLPAIKQPVLVVHRSTSARSGRDGSVMLQRRLGGRVESVMIDERASATGHARDATDLADRGTRFIAAVLEENETRRGNERRRRQIAAGRTDAA